MSNTPENIKSLFWIPDRAGSSPSAFVPHLYLEARIDFNDVRTGFKKSYSINRAVRIPEEKSERFWDDDAVLEIDPGKLRSAAPENIALGDLPRHVDGVLLARTEAQFIEYLLRFFTVKVYRNFSLDLYSTSGESRNDFIIRCVDLYRERMYGEFGSVHKVFLRRLERLQQKYLGTEDSEELEKSKKDSSNRELFYRISERISALFLRTEYSIQHVAWTSESGARKHELEERLRDLYLEARETVSRILDSYEDKIRSVDEYILHPNMKNIHFVNSSILWMPAGAGEPQFLR
jgi:hypothetical protein